MHLALDVGLLYQSENQSKTQSHVRLNENIRVAERSG